MNEYIVKLNELYLKLDICREKLNIAVEGLNAINNFTKNSNNIAVKTLEEIEKLDSND